MLSNSFDLNDVVESWYVIRSVRARRERAIMGVAADNRPVPALHGVVRADDGRRALFDPSACVWVDLRIITIPTDLGLLIARRALPDPLA